MKRRTTNLKPSPPDDSGPSGYFDSGWQHGSADDDSQNLRPFLQRLIGRILGADISAYRSGQQALQGAHFRIGYQGYDGVMDAWPMQAAESGTTIGRPIRMRPPIIPRRTASPLAVRNAINFVQSMPYETWQPIIAPIVSRR